MGFGDTTTCVVTNVCDEEVPPELTTGPMVHQPSEHARVLESAVDSFERRRSHSIIPHELAAHRDTGGTSARASSWSQCVGSRLVGALAVRIPHDHSCVRHI
jgi:hypothetical protein